MCVPCRPSSLAPSSPLAGPAPSSAARGASRSLWIALGLLAAGCGGGGGGGGAPAPGLPGGGAPGPTAGGLIGNYRGTATTRIQVLSPFGGIVSDTTFQHEVVARIGQPASVLDPTLGVAEVEPNPVNLTLEPTGATNAEGQLSLRSGLAATITETEAEILLTYWDLDVEGSDLSGVLAETKPQGTATATNLIQSLDPTLLLAGIPFVTSLAMRDGVTRLDATVQGDTLELDLTGNSTYGVHPFASRMTLTRF